MKIKQKVLRIYEIKKCNKSYFSYSVDEFSCKKLLRSLVDDFPAAMSFIYLQTFFNVVAGDKTSKIVSRFLANHNRNCISNA